MSKWKTKSTIKGLVLRRTPGQKIIINHGELIIELVEIHGQAARIALAATKDIDIRRAEASDEEHEKTLAKVQSKKEACD